MYTVTGTVPTPMYNPKKTFFQHHVTTAPTGGTYANGESGRTISVNTDSEAVANRLKEVFEAVFEDAYVLECADLAQYQSVGDVSVGIFNG